MKDHDSLMQAQDMMRNSLVSFSPLRKVPAMPTTPASRMRAFLPLLVLVSALPACRCAPATPTPVTLRVKNTSRDTILLRDTKGQLGLTVQRNVNGEWFSFDDLPCACQSCDRICERSCQCPDGGISDQVLAIPPNGQAERSWDGVIQVAGFACNQVCLVPENAPADETFQVQLCFVNQIDGVTTPADGGRVSATFPQPDVQTCVVRQFQPQQGVVEISPARGADCTTTADCRGRDELCLSGSCTAGCPANAFPPQPELFVTVSNSGFYTESREADAGVTLRGEGRIVSTQFVNETFQLSLSSANGSGRVDVKLPGGLGGPSLMTGTDVRVQLVTRTVDDKTWRAVTVRTVAGELLFAADPALAGPALAAADLAPFTIGLEPAAVGCRVDASCGKFVFAKQALSNGTASIAVEPGKLASLSVGTQSVRFWNVTAGQYGAASTCASYRPWVLWRENR
jgi:hypothetical protein